MGDKSWMKKPTDANTISAYGKNSDGYAPRKEMFESDAKMLAGKEQREMQAIFGKSGSHTSTSSTSKKFESSKSSGGGQLPSMFASGGGASGTLMSSGSAATMKVDTHVYDSTTGGAKAAGKPMDKSSVSKLNMGSAGIMESTKSSNLDVANRGKFGSSGGKHVDYGVSKMNMGSAGVMNTSTSKVMTEANRGSYGASGPKTGVAGATKTVSRDPMSQNGVLRKFAWEN